MTEISMIDLSPENFSGDRETKFPTSGPSRGPFLNIEFPVGVISSNLPPRMKERFTVKNSTKK